MGEDWTVAQAPAQNAQKVELELVLVRHGHTQWNRERRYLGSTDLPLLPEERGKLVTLGEQPELTESFWRVYCSDLLRCRETLSSIAPSLEDEAIYDSRLRETCFGEWEGCTYEQLKNVPQYRSWIDDPAAVTPPGGEAWGAFAARLEHFLSDLVQEAEAGLLTWNAVECREEPLKLRVLIVTHGGVIRQWLAKAEPGVTFQAAAAPPPGTATVLTLLWQAGIDRSGGVNLCCPFPRRQ
ncbi:histidine phosphatase family protein [Paenibacillus sp. HW567]|uniref:histidine phosphatase family protein n=1 Tax=Paenibacillus sp. HW567 TaxID=1034769 RepID=UPI00036ACB57|nr:histidine phosphatase family protein [Paenibacillus sp. HW567]